MNTLTRTLLFYCFCSVCIPCICRPALAAARTPPPVASSPSPEALVTYDRGEKKGARAFRGVEACTDTPCVVTQHTAWQFAPEVVRHYRVEMGYIHEGSLRPITLFQQSTTLEQKLGERLFNRYPNRKIVNLTRMVETGATSTIYMYGILLQNEVREGDPIVITLTELTDPSRSYEYYFRYHRNGPVPDLDLTFLYPINFFHPNPGNVIQGAEGGVAFSFSLGTNMDPEKRYRFLRKMVRAVRLNLFTGLMTRKELSTIGGDLIVRDTFDGFGGVGITFFDFLNAGYGINFVRSPHSFFPFVGIEVRHVFQFIRSLKQDTHTKWEKYLKHEGGR